MPPTVAEVFREDADHPAERTSPLMQALLLGAADDWDAGGVTRAVLEVYAGDREGSALPLRFAAALHRLVLTGQAPELAAHYPTVGGTAAPELAWAPARRVLERQTARVRELTGQPCQTNEVGRTVPLLVGLAEVARRTGGPLQLWEIGASAGLNLLVDRFRFGEVWGPPDSPCRLPAPGVDLDLDGVVIVDRAGCDPAPLDPGDDEARLRLTASIWGDQVERFRRLRGALEVAGSSRVPVERAGAAEWLGHRLGAGSTAQAGVPVVWHSIVRTYVDPDEWRQVEELTARAGVWRLAYEPDPEPGARTVPLRLHGPGIERGGEVLVRGSAHGPPLSAA
ncbi:DUF2332 domain-containing protein [Blastococcus goldschmidtiae]|uniref:DUF2332 domain-containing protein n=1 Tax=Blastococcus goldschmidtiae TaxID=3075546 RepID=A0ABU2K932_9ACTN|nr:DUF2332 domain-containing protein [Blastococcus sp. DSM 46792]MDT0276692.1 DUF2332 domain-containing protein [Blastococcus sp. DSM 46792]